jgi:hypothetical protein
MDLEDAIALLEAKASSPSFRKAVGGSVVEAINTLIEQYKCNILLSQNYILKLLNDYYIFESRIKRLIELYEELSKGALSAVLRAALGEDAELPDADYGLLLKELKQYREELFKLAGLVKEAERRCHSASSNA